MTVKELSSIAGEDEGGTETVLGCVLRELSYEGETVVKYLDEIQRVRGWKGWLEAVWQSEIVRK